MTSDAQSEIVTIKLEKLNKDMLRTSTKDLLGGGTRLEIEHQGSVYRLQLTRQGKLILTK